MKNPVVWNLVVTGSFFLGNAIAQTFVTGSASDESSRYPVVVFLFVMAVAFYATAAYGAFFSNRS